MKIFLPWVVILLALVTACDGGRREGTTQAPLGGRARLVVPGPPCGSVSVQMPAHKQQSFVHGSYIVSLDESGEVKVNSVEFQTGLEVTGWAFRPAPGQGQELAGDWRGAALATRGIENTEVLTRVCEGQANSYELVLQVRSGESSTEGDGIVVRYTSDGRDGALALRDRVVLCVRPERPECA